ncbi:cardiolipin synthase ClsB [Roseateles amylovorans]|uniref:Cardiolipin synthase B n=1 Tax=Roseateles amylovorans TaxID=2978473 RepID=A0ABY6B3X7_9BURK|nr:cardiolipin synthase ClsB [Roseateles amylovorans]UXH79547.1 cardiolipin synthase ClsB [Roseateles amylovorans]
MNRPAEPLFPWTLGSQPSFTGGNAVELLCGGDALFPAQIAAIDAARHEVWLATYIFHHDDAGAATAAALCRAAARGVRVRVVVDGFGSKASLGWLREQLQQAPVALAVFRPIDRWWNWLHPGQLRRLHQKLCVVDGMVGFVGGINIIGDRMDLHHGRTDTPRLDYAVRVSGPVVRPVEQAVRAVWTRAWLGHDFGDEVRAMIRSASPGRRARRLMRRIRMPRGDHRRRDPTVLPPMRAAFVLRDNFRQRRTIEHAYVEAIQAATTRVDLITPYFYPGQRFRRALKGAAKRGVQVRLLLQGKVDYRIAALAARALYEELLGHGVQIYEYTPAFLHAKVCVVDNDWATVGSSNIDPLSLLLNLEANVVVRDAAFAGDVVREFDGAIARSRRVEQPDGRGLRGMLRRGLVAWVAYVYLRVAGATGRY